MSASAQRILVVDDEEIIRESYQLALTDAGYDVCAVASGRDAIQACRSAPFELMLADLRMADMDGIALVRRVSSEFPHIRTVIITGYPSPKTARQARELGVLDYLEKPISPEQLSRATAAALTRPCSRQTAGRLKNTGEPASRKSAAAERPEADSADFATPRTFRVLADLGMLAVASLIGLAYFLLFPIVAAGIGFTALGAGCVKTLGWAGK